ncbi:MAG: hypothetical protein B7Y48_04845 [Methylophilales bacterium 28-44-11]|nr:MAG: hypothetical protein B7Y48_04845 [Methylophilales bacterium 28-44-11]
MIFRQLTYKRIFIDDTPVYTCDYFVQAQECFVKYRYKQRIAQLLLLFASLFSLATSVIFFFLFFRMYWPYRALFDTEGRYFDIETLVVYQEVSGILLLPALGLMIFAMILLSVWYTRRNQNRSIEDR